MGPGTLVVQTRTCLKKMAKPYTWFGILPASFTHVYQWHSRSRHARSLAHSPPLPLTIDYGDEDGITAEDEEGILLALEQRHRVHHLRLVIPVQNLQNLATAIDAEFPILEYLILWPSLKEGTPLMIPETLQASTLRHLTMSDFACPRRPRLHPTAVGLVYSNHDTHYTS